VNPSPAADQASPLELKEWLEAERAGEPFLVYRDGEGRQRILSLPADRERLTIGRLPRNDLELGWDPKVSRVHAALERLGATWMVEDEGLSTNGTYVNEQRLSGRRLLRDGDVIRTGGTILRFCVPAGESARTSVEREVVVEPPTERIVATVLFTDIVDSTRRAAELGDQRWREVLARHNDVVRDALARFRGREVKTTGDGFLATFDGPARAVRCAEHVRNELEPLEVDVRSGLHTGEIELIGDDVGGIAVHIAARISAMADAGEILASSTVRDLVAGSGILFDDRGMHALKGIPDEWRIVAVSGERAASP
jgi:class 3 adenylate cyclase